MLLPDNYFWKILRNSTRNDNSSLLEEAGPLLEYKFWPKWNPSGTTNANYVEPDVFFRFEKLDVIIEAKYGEESGQYYDEWEREVIAYSNEFSKDFKTVVLFAIGGNSDFKKVVPIKVNDATCYIFKYKWGDLLEQLNKIENDLIVNSTENKSSLNRLILLIKEGFKIMGINENKRTDVSAFGYINTFQNMFDDACNRKTGKYELSKKGSISSSADYYIYSFEAKSINSSKQTVSLSIGMWYKAEAICLEMYPQNDYAQALIDTISEKEKDSSFSRKYLTSQYNDKRGSYDYCYINASVEFYSDFGKSTTYSAQLEILNNFIDELLNLYF